MTDRVRAGFFRVNAAREFWIRESVVAAVGRSPAHPELTFIQWDGAQGEDCWLVDESPSEIMALIEEAQREAGRKGRKDLVSALQLALPHLFGWEDYDNGIVSCAGCATYAASRNERHEDGCEVAEIEAAVRRAKDE